MREFFLAGTDVTGASGDSVRRQRRPRTAPGGTPTAPAPLRKAGDHRDMGYIGYQPLRALVEEGLRRVLDEDSARPRFVLEDKSVGTPGATNPLEAWSWQDLRDEIYGGS